MLGDTLYAWQALTEDGWSQIVAFVPFAGMEGPLTARQRHLADVMRPLAVKHGQGLNQPVRLARFTVAETLEQIEP